MKLLHIADIHLDRVFHRAESRPAAVRRRGELRDALARALALGREREVDAVCIAGDVYEHEYVSEDTISFLRDAFAAAGSRTCACSASTRPRPSTRAGPSAVTGRRRRRSRSTWSPGEG